VYGVALSGAEIAAEIAASDPRRDADGDSMPDQRETYYFGGTDVPRGAALDDWDGDGLPNGAEYAAGTDPTNAVDVFRLEALWTAGRPGIALETRAAQGEFYTGLERRYSLENRTNLSLGLWQGVPGFTNLLGDGQPRIYAPPAEGPAFYRGKAWLR
jgi:hypothetical protein